MNFQDIIMNLERFWSDRGCLIVQPYDLEVGGRYFRPGHHPPLPGPGALEGGLCPAQPEAHGRTLWARTPIGSSTTTSSRFF